ncbi:MAG: prepilin peptidase [Clostridia bacterium]|nr:prepilin peptidase [Clostridia bacterium]
MNLLFGLILFFVVFSTLFGIVIGSFLNVVIYRVPVGRTISKGRSMCMSCGHTLSALDLVPMFSWLFLRGKCRYCKAPIASRYIKIESFTGLTFLVCSLLYRECAYLPIAINDSSLARFYVFYFFRYILLLISFCLAISTMMIYHDTGKCFKVFPIVLSSISVVYLIVYSTVFEKYRVPSIGIIVLVVFFVILKIFEKMNTDYDKGNFLFDLTNIYFIATVALLNSFSSFVPMYVFGGYALIYFALRYALRKSKFNKYIGIINTCSVVILLSLVYIIVL